jgi:hypothetical protein
MSNFVRTGTRWGTGRVRRAFVVFLLALVRTSALADTYAAPTSTMLRRLDPNEGT